MDDHVEIHGNVDSIVKMWKAAGCPEPEKLSSFSTVDQAIQWWMETMTTVVEPLEKETQ